MNYQIEDNVLLLEIDRRKITDINAGDVLEAGNFPGATYTWTAQDSQFMESNPEAEVYLRFEKKDSGYHGTGITVL